MFSVKASRSKPTGRGGGKVAAFFALTWLILMIGACTASNHGSKIEEPVESHPSGFYLEDDEIRKMNQMILDQASMNNSPGDYLLGEGDLLRVSIFEAEELKATVRVNSRGWVTLPLIDKVDVKGLTAIEAEEKIEHLYSQRYIKDPHVSIFVEEHISQRITLVGEFNTPGSYDYPTRQRLLDVIALGGGLSEKAGQIIQIRKSKKADGQPEVLMVDLDRLIIEGNYDINIEIDGGDVIYIPEAGVFFVNGAVKQPGAYPIKHRTVIQEALVEAGGVEPWADKNKVQLVRMEKDGTRKNHRP